ncbi:Transcriptional regulator PadR-like family protein [Streptomyces sp. KS_16]|nr:PadR family transcriptional regulator [Streptomyces sp. 2321.6]SDR29051.1 Transcriptional regulator PadR-like family protein [Streptomyces sp. KS_16]SED35737.1 transcriptional regulator, PadR family [Streptomyces sp. 2133.1]SNC70640.1 Transcriptional regulator PadR-like family protein [Streptomyces sp. 2114.4]
MYRRPVTSTFRRSPLALAVLGLLEAGPLHPYGIQRLIKQWGKDQVVNVGQRAGLYRTIARLEDAGLIAVGSTERDERYPERTTYRLTDTGRAAARQWMAEILSTPRNEYPEFPAALSFLPVLTPRATQDLLHQRRDRLARRLTELDAELASEAGGHALPRVALIESEYLRAVTQAELAWVDGILSALADGSFTWNREELDRIVATARDNT